MAGSSLRCAECGFALKPGARFCTSCGCSVTQMRSPEERPPRDSPGRRPPLAGLIGGGILVLAGAAAAVILTTHPFSSSKLVSATVSVSGSPAHRLATASTATAAPATASPVPAQSASLASSPSTTAQVTEQQAAQQLGDMLAQSVSDRTAITQAVSDVRACGPSLSQDPQVFQSAASSRTTLLAELANMAGASTLPAPMLQDLSGAWQASVDADKDFARWADDEVTHPCVQNDNGDPGSVAAKGPDAQATTDKKAFVSMWDTIAMHYGLTTYTWEQL